MPLVIALLGCARPTVPTGGVGRSWAPLVDPEPAFPTGPAIPTTPDGDAALIRIGDAPRDPAVRPVELSVERREVIVLRSRVAMITGCRAGPPPGAPPLLPAIVGDDGAPVYEDLEPAASLYLIPATKLPVVHTIVQVPLPCPTDLPAALAAPWAPPPGAVEFTTPADGPVRVIRSAAEAAAIHDGPPELASIDYARWSLVVVGWTVDGWVRPVVPPPGAVARLTLSIVTAPIQQVRCEATVTLPRVGDPAWLHVGPVPPLVYRRDRFDGDATAGWYRISNAAGTRVVVDRPIGPATETGCEADLEPRVVGSATEASDLGLGQIPVDFTRQELVVFGGVRGPDPQVVDVAPTDGAVSIRVDHKIYTDDGCCTIPGPHPPCDPPQAPRVVGDAVDWTALQRVYRVLRAPAPTPAPTVVLVESAWETCMPRDQAGGRSE